LQIIIIKTAVATAAFDVAYFSCVYCVHCVWWCFAYVA